jgi:hypothetical protein
VTGDEDSDTAPKKEKKASYLKRWFFLSRGLQALPWALKSFMDSKTNFNGKKYDFLTEVFSSTVSKKLGSGFGSVSKICYGTLSTFQTTT